ncbi:uncharacterized, partial [Tachysurus ichikawai]
TQRARGAIAFSAQLASRSQRRHQRARGTRGCAGRALTAAQSVKVRRLPPYRVRAPGNDRSRRAAATAAAGPLGPQGDTGARALIDSCAPSTACARHILHRKKGPTAFQTQNVPHARCKLSQLSNSQHV